MGETQNEGMTQEQLHDFAEWISETYDLRDGTYYDDYGKPVSIHQLCWKYLEGIETNQP